MSEIVLFNLLDSKDYDTLNCFANEIVEFAIRKHLGVHFNELGYASSLIREQGMTHYFFVSDSFLHCNASFIDMSDLSNLNGLKYKFEFFKKLSFLNKIFKILKKHKIFNVELYISSDGILDGENDFTLLSLSGRNWMNNLYNFTIERSEEWAYEIPSVKIVLEHR